MATTDTIKLQLKQTCVQIIRQKLDRCQSDLAQLNESMKEETKSSAGDKYETSRAVMQQEWDKLQKYESEQKSLLSALEAIDTDKSLDRAFQGALVFTDVSIFWLVCGLGQVELENQLYFVLSPSAPLSKCMWGKNIGESFSFLQKTYHIKNIL